MPNSLLLTLRNDSDSAFGPKDQLNWDRSITVLKEQNRLMESTLKMFLAFSKKIDDDVRMPYL
jgi:hypothetical protein